MHPLQRNLLTDYGYMTQHARDWSAVCMDAPKDPHKDSVSRCNSLRFPRLLFPAFILLFFYSLFLFITIFIRRASAAPPRRLTEVFVAVVSTVCEAPGTIFLEQTAVQT